MTPRFSAIERVMRAVLHLDPARRTAASVAALFLWCPLIRSLASEALQFLGIANLEAQHAVPLGTNCDGLNMTEITEP
jgi:hypothetical protein